jgi:DnaJ-class molecular chaperone
MTCPACQGAGGHVHEPCLCMMSRDRAVPDCPRCHGAGSYESLCVLCGGAGDVPYVTGVRLHHGSLTADVQFESIPVQEFQRRGDQTVFRADVADHAQPAFDALGLDFRRTQIALPASSGAHSPTKEPS